MERSSAHHHTQTYPWFPYFLLETQHTLTRINPRDEMCQELTSQVEYKHDEEKYAKTQSSMRLANTSQTLKVIAILELTQLLINLIKALLESDLGTFSSEKRWFFGCHGRIVILEEEEKEE